MKDLLKKITNSLLAIGFSVVAIGSALYFTGEERMQLLSGSILDGVSTDRICAVEFSVPSGAAFPINGVVSIQSVYVTVDTNPSTGTPCDGTSDTLESDNLSGANLEESIINFVNGVTPCPAGTVYSGNEIILPDTFASACSVGIEIPGSAVTSSNDLTVEPVSCAALQTSILRGQGAGFEEIATPGSLASTINGFDFDAAPITSIDLNYPTTTVDGAKTFQIHLSFVSDIGADPVNGVASQAEIVSNAGNGIYTIKVRDEGTGNEAQTALNFAYVFNDLLGLASPLLAYQSGTDPATILLQSREIGAHANSYVCILNGTQVGPPCFTGGADGTGEGAGVLTTPLTLNNEMVQGDTATVFAAGSAGEVQWISSHPAVLEVTSLSEADEGNDSIIDFLDEVLTIDAVNPVENSGAYQILDCQEEYDDSDTPVLQSQVCNISITLPVEYDISSESYTVNITVDDEVIEVPVTGSSLVGTLTGTTTWTYPIGMSFTLNGKVTGSVTGTVAGLYSGSVSGIVEMDVSANESISSSAKLSSIIQLKGFDIDGSEVSGGTLSEQSNSFVTTIKKEDTDMSHVSLLYAKRPGTTILTAIDKQGCIATFDVEVIEQKVILEMVGRSPGDVLDVSDTVQINAFVGAANGEKDEYKNITSATGIEWFSSNEDVATIDETGLLTALKPGVTNITAHYDTGEAEIGTIESVPLQVTVNKITGIRVTFDKDTEEELPSAVVDAAHKSVIIAVHSPEAAGQTLIIEGQQVPIILPAGDYDSDIDKIDAIVNDGSTGLKTVIDALQNDASTPQSIVKVTSVDGFPGMLILQPENQDAESDIPNTANYGVQNVDENSIIDIDTTALESDISILPTYNNAIPLPASKTYGLMVMAKYDNGSTKLLPPTEFNWVNTPANYLEQASLNSGLIKLGEIAGTSTVVAQYANADGSTVQSNYLTIKVDSGPVIEYVRRIGSGPITKGSRINLQTKVTDVNTIADIVSIDTSLVYSNFDTYTQINADSGAIWFSADNFLNEVAVVQESNPESTETVEGEAVQESVTTTSLQFKTYSIPVEIPVDQNLFDGIYKLILTISDANNHTINYVYPVRIGDIGEGDVNGDGLTNMVDVIIAFQIASGILASPTPSQLEAANVDGIGGVTLVDVILLFNTVTK